MEMGKAISQKIREAIKAKLIDLGNYVDEELPDYIMVMIANKKTEEQMKDDLALFLGANTDKFTGWLQGVLTKLQAARNEQKVKKEKAKEKKKSKKKDGKKEKTRRHSADGSKESGSKGDKEVDDSSGAKHGSSEKTVEVPEKATGEVVEGEGGPGTSIQSQDHAGKPSVTLPATATAAKPASILKRLPSSEPVISLVPDTNDFLAEEIEKNDAVKRATAETTETASVTLPAKRESSTAKPTSEVPRKTPERAAGGASPVIVSAARSVDKPHQNVIVTLGTRGRVSQNPVPARGPVKSRLGIPAMKQRGNVQEHPRPSSSNMSAVLKITGVPTKRKGPGSVIGQVIHDEEDSDDEPAVKRLASTVKPRRRQALPKTKQNSTVLLKKAMTQAQESTSVFPVAGQFAEPVRMIVRSASQSGSMKIVARSIPADRDNSSIATSSAHKKIFSRAVGATGLSTAKPKAKPPVEEKVAVTVRPLGLMSRSRFKEAKERNFDAHEYQRVESEKEDAGGRESVLEVIEQQPEEQQVEEKEDEADMMEDEKKITVRDDDDEGLETERQIMEIIEASEQADVTEELPLAVEGEFVEQEVRREGAEEEEEEEEMEEEVEVEEVEKRVPQEPTGDTRTTTIVRPIQFDTLSVMQKRTSPPQAVPVLPTPIEDVNPRFIVTLEGRRKGMAFPFESSERNSRLASATPFQSSRLLPSDMKLHLLNSSLEQSEVGELEEMETVEEEEDSFFLYDSTTPLPSYHHVVQKHHPIYEKEVTVGRVQPSQHLIKDPTYTPPQPKVAPVTFSLQESDEDQDHGQDVAEEIKERCKFWPACKNGSDCPYIHPSKPCRTFPNCKFGDKCLFIHPNCKFDATCMNPSCPYTHATRTKPAQVIIQTPPVRAVPRFKPTLQSKTVCKFHPNCRNVKCPFLHPKMCHFGRECKRPDCKFTHSSIASRSAMKWTKDKHISERQFASKATSLPGHHPS
ncbi:uncharacterized protein [Diadema setosum]|uniref:uncharacterized protein n=1 Tax=Diadema setosum TaxID=31175 RepID=UPI003B3AF33C